MAAALQESLDVETTLIPGKVGDFEVRDGERLVFSKQAEGRFPETDEILRLLES